MKFFSAHSGETLIEVIIAIGILAIVIGEGAALYVHSIRNTANNRSDLIAAVLAEEGIEMARSFRDSNLMNFSSKASDCWDSKSWDAAVTVDNCDAPASKISDGVYILKMNPVDFSWMLEPLSARLSEDLSLPSDETYRLKLADSPPIYNYDAGEDSIFYREIKISRIVISSSPREALEIVSRVLYRVGNETRAIKRGVELTKSSI